MSERRHEVRLVVSNLTPEAEAAVVAVLTPLATKLVGKLTVIHRDHFEDGHALHVGRRKVV